MAQERTLGGDRLGSGNRHKIFTQTYERSTHDRGYIARFTASAGTLSPFLVEPMLPGTTFDINLNCDIKTHPTVGPLFGSFKASLDVFTADMRLYIGVLHNNRLDVGLNMQNVKLPALQLQATNIPDDITANGGIDLDNFQINPSTILAMLNIRGIGQVAPTETQLNKLRSFNGIPYLAYNDIYKNYYANKQEGIGAVIHSTSTATPTTITGITAGGGTIAQAPATNILYLTSGVPVIITYSGAQPDPSQILFNVITYGGIQRQLSFTQFTVQPPVINATTIQGIFNYSTWGPTTLQNWQYMASTQMPLNPPTVVTFPLADIDTMRDKINQTPISTQFNIIDQNLNPYKLLLGGPTQTGATPKQYLASQEGLLIKTYQSDLFNNWLNTTTVNAINLSATVDTSGGSFNMDALSFAKHFWKMQNDIMASGGTYDDYLDIAYDEKRYQRPEIPIYHGGLIKELVFQEVVSNSSSSGGTTPQPLGTLAGRGVMAKKHKGGQIRIKATEPTYCIGIFSLTPRIDYSQGNKWDTTLQTMADWHKPPMDQIGFQDLIEEPMAWWTTNKPLGGSWTQKSAGKQPAWTNYTTNVNIIRGNFAVQNNEMFMVLNRRYEVTNPAVGSKSIKDLTTYIDPVKFNNIFAVTSLDAMNFWVQIAVDITSRQKQSHKIMPTV